MTLALTILVDGISYAAWLFLVSLGLTLVFGVLRLLNVAHGGLYSFGAYSAAFAIGLSLRAGWGTAAQLTVMVLFAAAVGAILSLTIERLVLNRLYHEHETLVLLATYAVFLVLEDLTKLIWGGKSLYANAPRDALGTTQIGALAFPVYDLLLIGVATAAALASGLFLSRTRIGRLVVAVTTDREMSAAMGINVARIMTGIFVAGGLLGALAGALTAPKIAVLPGIGVEMIVLAFAVVVVGGLGSITGAVFAAVIIGLLRAFASHLVPTAEVFVIYAVMTAVLAFRPYGLFSPPVTRKI